MRETPTAFPVSGTSIRVIPLVVLLGAHAALAGAQPTADRAPRSTLTLETGKQIYELGCVSCHGKDGKGQPKTLAGFEPPGSFPDFSDCATSTPESDVQWRAVITHGGPARGFSPIMPAFENLLSADQIDKVIDHVRGLCTEPAWPRGDLNFPRALMTEKAFPENEVVFSSWRITQSRGVVTDGQDGQAVAIYERRIGPSGMVEASVPYQFTHDIGEFKLATSQLAIGYKQMLFHSLEKGSIVSVGLEVLGPRASREFFRCGVTTAFEPFVAYGQRLPADGFLQLNVGAELPVHVDQRYRGYYVRGALGKTFAKGDRLGRRWSPMIEFVAERYPAGGAPTAWDVIPELQIPISRRLHVLRGARRNGSRRGPLARAMAASR